MLDCSSTASTAKKAKTSDWSFLKDSSKNNPSQIKKKRSYGSKHVCLACVNNKSLKNKSISIICRGTLDQLKRHYERQHCTTGSKCMYTNKSQFKDIVPIDHCSVPSHIRALAIKERSDEKQSENNSNNQAVAPESNLMLVAAASADNEGSSTQDAMLQIESDVDEQNGDEQPYSPTNSKQGPTFLQSGIEGYYAKESKPNFE
jgi:hypothetical protein